MGVLPAPLAEPLDGGIGAVAVHITCQKLWIVVGVGGGILDDESRLLLTRGLAHVIEMGVDEAKVGARLAVAQAHPVGQTHAGAVPRSRSGYVGAVSDIQKPP